LRGSVVFKTIIACSIIICPVWNYPKSV